MENVPTRHSATGYPKVSNLEKIQSLAEAGLVSRVSRRFNRFCIGRLGGYKLLNSERVGCATSTPQTARQPIKAAGAAATVDIEPVVGIPLSME